MSQTNVVGPGTSFEDEADVIVVGFGGAGACAALQAASEGASVLVLDRFHGGGATRISGGVYYGGGGTFRGVGEIEEYAETVKGYVDTDYLFIKFDATKCPPLILNQPTGGTYY